ncbi:hypothetical protein DFH29DRAFT_894610 [Suillus ampliporus]|nr:hypothetical protein DFH29DRAFT_894610 [Suillus ampliporus]
MMLSGCIVIGSGLFTHASNIQLQRFNLGDWGRNTDFKPIDKEGTQNPNWTCRSRASHQRRGNSDSLVQTERPCDYLTHGTSAAQLGQSVVQSYISESAAPPQIALWTQDGLRRCSN